MNQLKVCFIGIGSIAMRHIRNLRCICFDKEIHLTVDAFRRKPIPVKGVDHVYCNPKSLPTDYDAIFITNPTNRHLETLNRFHYNGKNFFIEKPVVSAGQIEEAERFNIRDDVVYYVASPLRYNSVVQWIKTNVKTKDVISVRSISSSYLPDWRPGQDYRNTYSAHRNMGGGVSIDLIHEWDYLTYLFGWPNHISSFIGKKSDLEIDSDDFAIYIAEYLSMIIEVHLDYFGRKTIREIELFTKDDTIIGDIENNKIVFLNNKKEIIFHEERDDYQKRELIHFIDMISGTTDEKDGFHHGLEVLKLTQG